MAERRVPWEYVLWTCPGCEGPLEPVVDADGDERPDDRQDPAVECVTCRRQYRMLFVPRTPTGTTSCPDCDGELEMAAPSVLRCSSCGQDYEVRERSWLEPTEAA